MKKAISILLILSLLMLTFNGLQASASGEEPQVYEGIGLKDLPAFVPDEVIVKFKNDSKPFRVMKVPVGTVLDKAAEYARFSFVEYAEPNYMAEAFGEATDPLYHYQWHFHNTAEDNPKGIDLEAAWDITAGTEAVIVAVIDTGIAYENYGIYKKAPDMANTKFIPGYDFINNDSHANDDNSHGTHVAGTIAQSTNNGVGVAGIAYNTTLMPVKVLSKKGSGSYTAIANGIRWAADHGADVINMSLGGSSPSTTLENALAYAYNKGVTIVAAAGNNGSSSVSYPAAYNQYVIAVGATRYDNALSYYSNYGSSLDIVAPGGDTSVDQNGDGYVDGVLQNTFNPNTKNVSDFGYWFFQGTSMASPHVAGVAALVIANGKATAPDEVRAALEKTATDLGNPGWDSTYGYGLLNAAEALAYTTEIPSDNTAPVAVADDYSTDEDTTLTIAAPGVLGNDTDAEEDPLDAVLVGDPSNGSVTLNTDGSFEYTPNLNYNGSDSFTYKANDGTDDSNVATVNITVNAVNDAPIAVGQTITMTVGETIPITLSGTDVDTEDTLTFAVMGVWPEGLTGTEPNLSFTKGVPGSVDFDFLASDGKLVSNTATISITIIEQPASDTPTVTISSMATDYKKAGKNNFAWAIATISITGESGPIEGAAVEGHWSEATQDVDMVYTNADGTVSVQSDAVKNPRLPITFTFTIDTVTIGVKSYDVNVSRSIEFISFPAK